RRNRKGRAFRPEAGRPPLWLLVALLAFSSLLLSRSCVWSSSVGSQICASRYIENVLKPHQEMKLKKLEERFYHMTGETWKLSNGHKLGGHEDLVLERESRTSSETSNREAAKRRNLPKPVTKVSPPAEQPTQKEVLDLPEEPPEIAEEVVTVALRCPSGRVLRRRFFKSCSSQVLFDWMMKSGYHTSLYSLSTSFPRRALEVERGWSLQDVGITVDTVLNVEEKEESN
ncbi:hypothetical protein EI555_015660, partial [Monodon monoceros]